MSPPTTLSPPLMPPLSHRVGAAGSPTPDRLNPPVDSWNVLVPDSRYRFDSPCRRPRRDSIRRRTDARLDEQPDRDRPLSETDAPLDRDFVLLVEAPAFREPRAWIEREDDGTHAIAVAFCPRLPQTAVPGEIVFVVDRSGSMGGPIHRGSAQCPAALSSLDNARQPVQHRRFRIAIRDPVFRKPGVRRCQFWPRRARTWRRSTPTSAAPRSFRPCSSRSNVPAVRWIAQVIVLTDGQVTNTDEVLALARAHAGHARIFTFGIGPGASHHLVRGLARAGGGAAEFIHPGERVEPKVVRQFGRIASPALTDVRIDWGGTTILQSPSHLGPVFTGGRLVAYGRTSQLARTTLRLQARSSSGPVSFEVPLDPEQAAAGRTVATIAARERIRELEESPASATARASRQVRSSADVSRERIVALGPALQPHVARDVVRRRGKARSAGRWFPATPTRARGADDRLGWIVARSATFSGGQPALAARYDRFRAPAAGDVLRRRLLRCAVRAVDDCQPRWKRARSAHVSNHPSPPGHRSPSGATPATRCFPTLALDSGGERHVGSRCSSARGRLVDMTPEFAAALACDLAIIEATCPGVASSSADRRAWATALAIAWLGHNAAGAKNEWSVVVRKARVWLEGNSGSLTTQAWLAVAIRVSRTPSGQTGFHHEGMKTLIEVAHKKQSFTPCMVHQESLSGCGADQFAAANRG